MFVTVLAGNPKPAPRTLRAAQRVAQELTRRPADLAIVAGPTYKSSYTSLPKVSREPVPAEPGASTPAAGLSPLDAEWDAERDADDAGGRLDGRPPAARRRLPVPR